MCCVDKSLRYKQFVIVYNLSMSFCRVDIHRHTYTLTVTHTLTSDNGILWCWMCVLCSHILCMYAIDLVKMATPFEFSFCIFYYILLLLLLLHLWLAVRHAEGSITDSIDIHRRKNSSSKKEEEKKKVHIKKRQAGRQQTHRNQKSL